MSTYLDFYCNTCRKEAGLRRTGRLGLDDALFKNILKLREHVILLRLVADIFRAELQDLPKFFAEHDGHELMLEDGYGRQWLPDQQRWTSVSRFEMENPEG